MIYNLIALLLNFVLGFLMISDKLFWAIGIIPLIGVLGMTLKFKKFSKLTIMVLLVAIFFGLIGIVQGFTPHYFYIIMNFSALFAILFESLKKVFFAVISWGLNAFAIGYLVTELREDMTMGIIIGIIIFIISFRDIVPTMLESKNKEKEK